MKRGWVVVLLLIVLSTAVVADTIKFSGYDWNVKHSLNNNIMGPGNNLWEKSLVSVDNQGKLHLKVKEINQQWYSSEVYLSNSLGYGKYQWTIDSPVDKIDDNLVLGLFLYQDGQHELDIEFTTWQYSGGWNYHYAVQPYYIKGNSKSVHLDLNSGSSTYTIDWRSDKIIFTGEQNGQVFNKWEYTGNNNFKPGK